MKSHLSGISVDDGLEDTRLLPTNRGAAPKNFFRSPYLEPNDWRNQRATGYDMYSQMTRRKAMQLAAITGEPALSGPVRLLQETNVRPQVGALVYQAIYWQPSKPFHSSEDRIRRLRGWAYSPLRMKDLIQGALATVKNPALQGSRILIYDSDQNSSDNLLYDNQLLADSKRLTHPRWSELTIANRNWLIGIQLGHRGLSAAGWSQTLLLQGTGAAGSELQQLGRSDQPTHAQQPPCSAPISDP